MKLKQFSASIASLCLITSSSLALTIVSSTLPSTAPAQAQTAGQAINTLRGCFVNTSFTATIAFNPTRIRQQPTTTSPIVGQFTRIGEVVQFSGITTGQAVPDSWDKQPDNMWYRLADGRGFVASAAISGYPPRANCTGMPDFWGTNYRSSNIFWQAGFAPKPYGDARGFSNPNAKGNCTWYAHGRLKDLGYRGDLLNRLSGNAGQWATQARNAGIAVGSAPRVGAIAQHTRDGFGHVAVVESINPNGTINLSESSYSGVANSSWDYLYRFRQNVNPAEFTSYIYVPR
jgi:surface antigen